jgi:hypothetical protein
VQHAFDTALRNSALMHTYKGFFNHEAPVQMKSGQLTDDLLISSESQLFSRVFSRVNNCSATLDCHVPNRQLGSFS